MSPATNLLLKYHFVQTEQNAVFHVHLHIPAIVFEISFSTNPYNMRGFLYKILQHIEKIAIDSESHRYRSAHHISPVEKYLCNPLKKMTEVPTFTDIWKAIVTSTDMFLKCVFVRTPAPSIFFKAGVINH